MSEEQKRLLEKQLWAVASGRWTATITNVYPNTYTVQVTDNDSGTNNGKVLISGTLTVAAQ